MNSTCWKGDVTCMLILGEKCSLWSQKFACPYTAPYIWNPLCKYSSLINWEWWSKLHWSGDDKHMSVYKINKDICIVMSDNLIDFIKHKSITQIWLTQMYSHSVSIQENGQEVSCCWAGGLACGCSCFFHWCVFGDRKQDTRCILGPFLLKSSSGSRCREVLWGWEVRVQRSRVSLHAIERHLHTQLSLCLQGHLKAKWFSSWCFYCCSVVCRAV